jgi:hypothetical protein
MSKKRAFVRYTKSGEIVPGSLIITTNGGYPDKSSLWQEVTVDQCCENGSECNLPSVTLTASGFTAETGCNPVIVFYCNEQPLGFEVSSATFCTAVPLPINMLSFYNNIILSCYSWVGTWSIDGEVVTLEMDGYLANLICPNGVLSMIAYTGCPALPNPEN